MKILIAGAGVFIAFHLAKKLKLETGIKKIFEYYRMEKKY